MERLCCRARKGTVEETLRSFTIVTIYEFRRGQIDVSAVLDFETLRGILVRLALITTVLSAIAIAVLSLYPVPQVLLPGSDKTHHFVAYAVLALPLSMVRPLYVPLTFLVVSFYGGVIELMQPAAGRM